MVAVSYADETLTVDHGGGQRRLLDMSLLARDACSRGALTTLPHVWVDDALVDAAPTLGRCR